MNKAIILTLVLSVFGFNSSGQVYFGLLLQIEQEIRDAKLLGFDLRKGDSSFCNFDYTNFESSGNYSNTNLYAYNIVDGIPMGKYTIRILFKTSDSSVKFKKDIFIGPTIESVGIKILIGKSTKGKTYMKNIDISTGIIINKDSVFLMLLDKPKLKDSPTFKIINLTKDNLYADSESGYFIGYIEKRDLNKEWNRYAYPNPYQKYDCIDSVIQSTNSQIAFCTTETDCSRTRINSKGIYKFKIGVLTAPKNEEIPINNLENGITRLRIFNDFRLESEFRVN